MKLIKNTNFSVKEYNIDLSKLDTAVFSSDNCSSHDVLDSEEIPKELSYQQYPPETIEKAYDYYNLYNNAPIYNRRFKITLFFLMIINLITVFTISILNNNTYVLLFIPIVLVSAILLYLIVFFSCRFYHRRHGERLYQICELDLTNRVITDVLHGFVHNDDEPGSGKDTLMVYAMNILDLHYRDKMEEMLLEYKRELVMFHLDIIEQWIMNTDNFKFSSEVKCQKNLEEFIIENEDIVLRNYYKEKNISLKLLFEDRELFVKNKYKANHVITDTLKYQHVLDILYKYSYIFYRFNKVKHIQFSNQPMLNATGLPAKVFSERFFWFKATHDAISNPDNQNKSKNDKDNNKYIPKVKFPFNEFMLVALTEQDIQNANVDKKSVATVKNNGISYFYSARRHICKDHFLIWSNAQTEGRQAKQIREHYTFKINIIRKPHLVEIHDCKIERLLKKVNKITEKVDTLQISNDEEKDKKLDNLTKERKELLIKIGKLKFLFLRCEVQVRPRNFHGTCEEIDKMDLLDRDKTLFIQGFKTTFVMDPRLTWGKYNTHFMGAMADVIRENSIVSIEDINTYANNLILRIEDIIAMDSHVMDMYSNLSFKDTAEHRYHIVEEKQTKRDRDLI